MTKQSILAEAFKLIKLILVAPATNAISERSFSALKRLKTKMRSMRSTMYNNRLNHLMVFHLYQDEIDKVDIREIANEFISRKDYGKERFSLL